MKTAILIYELRQVGTLVDFLSSVSEEDRKSLAVIALGADIEFALQKLAIHFQSGRGLRRVTHFECLTRAEEIAREVLDDPTCSFFSYRSVPLANVFMFVLQDYLMQILYFVDVLTTLTEKYPKYERIILFPHAYIPLETDGIMAPLEVNVAVDAARIVGATHNLKIFIPTAETWTTMVRMRVNIFLFSMKRMLFGWGLFLINTLVVITVPKKKIRILASDNWRNISPIMQHLPEAELLLLDRMESRRAGLSAIWKNRMRFIHIQNFVSSTERKVARAQVDNFTEQWKQVQNANDVLQKVEFRSNSLTPMLSVALENILVRGGKRAVDLINGTYALYEQMQPDVVLVRANFSTQIHFPILCYVARALGIPSLEVQHGLIYLGTRSGNAQSAVQNIATYGPLTSNGYKKLGYTDDTLFNIGSPRFDAYKIMRDKDVSAPASAKPFTVSCVVPAILPHSWSDSYEVVEYLSGVAAAASRIPNVLVVLKLRPGPVDEAFYRSAIAHTFASVPHKIAQYDPFVDVCAEADAIVVIYSTTVLEALISGKPVIYNGTLEYHKVLGKELSGYAVARALLIANTQEELAQFLESLAHEPKLRKALVERADVFMKENYSFDGKASEKLANVVRFLAHKKTETYASRVML